MLKFFDVEVLYLSSEYVLGFYLIFLYVFSDPCAFVTDIVSILILLLFRLIFQTTL